MALLDQFGRPLVIEKPRIFGFMPVQPKALEAKDSTCPPADAIAATVIAIEE